MSLRLRSAAPVRLAAALALAVATVGCTVYEVAPGVYSPSPPGAFDRSWNAALGAFQDQGVQLLVEDRAAGSMRGRRGGIDVTASLRPQADGSLRVQFDGSGTTGEDPTLIQRVSRSYDVRMGR